MAAAEEIFDGIEQELAMRVGGRAMEQLRALLEPLHTALLAELAESAATPEARGRDR